MRPIVSLNQVSATDFAESIRPLFEAAPPLADALYAHRPYASYEHLIETAEQLVDQMSLEDRVVILSAHPRIGAPPETVSAASFREQGYADEDRSALKTVYDQLAQLNREYEDRFGFRFVVFVNKRPKAEIVNVLRERMNNSRDEELRTGLRDMFLIARDRLWSQT